MNLKDSLLVLGAIEETPAGASIEDIQKHIDISEEYLWELLHLLVCKQLVICQGGFATIGAILTDEGRTYLSQNEGAAQTEEEPDLPFDWGDDHLFLEGGAE